MEISLCSYFLLFLFLYLLTNYFLRKFRNLPPSPPLSLPLIGHLYLLKKPVHRTLAKVSQKYGPVLFLQFGSRPVLLVSSPCAAEKCLTKNDIIFANRPRFLAGKYLGYDYSTLVWASYGHHWRNLRRIASLEILSSHRIQMFADIRRDEVISLIKRLFEGSKDGRTNTVNMKLAFFEMTLNIMMRMIDGKRYFGDSAEELEETMMFREIVKETFRVSGATNIGDFIPFLKWVGLTKLEHELNVLKEKRDRLMQHLIDEHKKTGLSSPAERQNKTMVDVLLSLQKAEPEHYTDEIVKGLMQVMLSAGTDTTVATMEWALSLLMNNKEALKKGQKEIDLKVGNTRLIEDSNLARLPFLHGIVNETLRMYPAAPMLPSHESSEDCVVGGYRVPRGTMLSVNIWAIHHDPKLWEEPSMFKPERFISLEGQRDGFNFMPFGYGRRGCPGENLAMRVVSLVLGSLIQCFEWERIGEEPIDMSEGSGLTMPKAQPLLAYCRPRPEMINLLSQLQSQAL